MKIFVISWFYPPGNSAEGMVTYKLLKNSQYEYDVFCNQSKDLFAFKKDKQLNSPNVKIINYSAESKEDWINEGMKYFEQHIDEYDAIMTRSMPRDSHMLGIKIKNKYPQVKWIASFSDPMYKSPYTKLIEEKNPYINMKNSIGKILKNSIWNLRRFKYRLLDDPERINRKVEKNTISMCDIIIFNNKYQQEFIMSNYSKYDYKSRIIPHSYDENLYGNVEKNNEKITISYLGHLDQYRNATCFLNALCKFKNEDDKYKNLKVDFYGNLSDQDKLIVLNNKLYDFVEIHEPVTYLESLSVMKKSDYLLLIDADLHEYIEKNIFFASKIVDYLGAEKKIIAITMPAGTTKDIMKKYDEYICNYSVDEIYDVLKKIINKKREEKVIICNEYNSKNVSKLLDEIVEEINNE